MYHGYPGMSKQVFHQLLELDAFASTQTSARFIEKRGGSRGARVRPLRLVKALWTTSLRQKLRKEI